MNKHDQIREIIDLAADTFDDGMYLISPKRLYNNLNCEYEKCKKRCRIIKLIVLIVCGIIVYLHFRGIV